ncbi:type II secretion system F family protein [Halosegnis marinus]|uniref:type II secretion system F family protein n=1 Tax=Halosegnis marinus TaxID=3034023 RepID=UPI00361FBBAC
MSNEDRGEAESALGDLVGDDEDDVPVPGYEAEQYLPSGTVSEDRREMFRREFGLVRAFFRSRPARYWRLQRRLNQARVGTTYDRYLTRSVTLATFAGIAGALAGALLTVVLTRLGVLGSIDSPVNFGTGALVRFVAENEVVVGGAALALVLALVGFGTVWVARLYYPSLVIDSRRRNIDVNLPHAIVYMYALSFGGMDLLEVLERTAGADETYGNVSDEFDMIIRDVELFGADLYTAIRNARNLTPSDNLESFLDDLLSVLDSGGDMTGFLREETEKYMDRAQNEQESFLDTLELLSEVFIVLFVAAPLFVVVIMMVMSFLGENTVPYLMVVIYAVIPLVMAAFLVIVSVLSDPYKQPDHDLKIPDDGTRVPVTADLRASPGFDVFRGLRLRARARAFLRAPLKPLYERPTLTLVATVPLAVLAAPLSAELLSVPLRSGVLLEEPFEATLALLVVPFFVVAFPLSLFYEADRRRREAIAEQLPDTLDILASANQMGVPLVKGIDLVTKNVSGALSTELRRTRNDMEWNYDIQSGLRGLADRVEVPQLTRTCNILAEGPARRASSTR